MRSYIKLTLIATLFFPILVLTACNGSSGAATESAHQLVQDLDAAGIQVTEVQNDYNAKLTYKGHEPKLFQFNEYEELFLLKYNYRTPDERDEILELYETINDIVNPHLHPITADAHVFYIVSTMEREELDQLAKDGWNEMRDLIMEAGFVASNYTYID
ncbi:hypothetical protein [Evansella tamaricis]|uniref:Lipoprotein n=1 Tax=Evansella tamaricis TaxID=2069301 RepID=A0ABS6J963_9BACI|nr:hypothetical protein [Evansella tamaricis]MBU9710221.1 hypothetical protein [Evansella tamaricis]